MTAWRILFLAVVLLATVQPAAADSLPTTELSLRSLGYNDVEMFGVNTASDVFVPGPGGIPVGPNNVLRLLYSHTALARPDVSTLTVRYNGSVVYQAFLTPANAVRAEARIVIPADLVQPDANRIQTIFYIRLPNDTCDASDNPAKTAAVHNGTTMTYDVIGRDPVVTTPDLGKFPTPFLRTTSSVNEEVVFALPTQPTSADLTAAAMIAARLGQVAQTKVITPMVVLGAPTTDVLKANNLIAVNPSSRFLDDLNLPLKRQGTGFTGPDGQLVGSNEGVIQIVPSPGNPARQVLVVGGSGEGLVRAAGSLASSTALKAMSGPYAVVNQIPLARRVGDAESPIPLRFSELGYRETTVSGSGTRALNFSFQSATPGGDGEIELIVSHSPLLNGSRSSMRVLVNNYAITSVSLTRDNANRGVIRFPVSARAIKGGTNTVTIEFNMYLSGDNDCGPIADERAWALLHGDSAFVRPVRSTGNAPSLGDFPFPFVDDGTAQDTVIVLPDDISIIGPALQLAVEFGRTMRDDFGKLTLMRESEVGEVVRDKQLILVGLPETSSLLREATVGLPLQLDGPFDRVFRTNNDIFMSIRDARRIAAVQLGRSPFNSSRTVATITATPIEALPLAVRSMRAGDLSGNLMITSDNGPGTPVKVATFDLRAAQPARRSALDHRDLVAIGGGAASGLLALLILAGLAFRVVRRS